MSYDRALNDHTNDLVRNPNRLNDSSLYKDIVGLRSSSGVAGRVRPSWDGGGRRTVNLFHPPQGQIRTADAKQIPGRTEADGGRNPSVSLKDGFGRRTGKISKKRREADAGRRRTKSVPRALVKVEVIIIITVHYLGIGI